MTAAQGWIPGRTSDPRLLTLVPGRVPTGKAVSQKPLAHSASHSANGPVAPKQADPGVPGRLPPLLLGGCTLQALLKALFAGAI